MFVAFGGNGRCQGVPQMVRGVPGYLMAVRMLEPPGEDGPVQGRGAARAGDGGHDCLHDDPASPAVLFVSILLRACGKICGGPPS